MKKLLFCTIMLGMLILLAPGVSAKEHTHCICAGTGGHSCEEIQWRPLSEVVKLKNVNWKNVPSGNYYLDGDVVVSAVTDSDCIGKISKDTEDAYTLEVARTVNLCLNGYQITTKIDRVFHGIYMGSELNICDCSGQQVNGKWQWRGKVTGGTSNSGGIFYTYANSTVNIYGGNFTAKADQEAKNGGGLFYIAQDRSAVGDSGKNSPDHASTVNIYNGNFYGGVATKNGGNIAVVHYSCLNIYDGSIHDGTVTTGNGGNIYASKTATLNIQNADIYGGYPEVAKLVTDGVASEEYTFADAIAAYKQGSVLRLYRDLETDITIEKTILLDLNGHRLSGVGITGNVTCMDSATDCMEANYAGLISCTNGTPAAAAGYLPVTEENGMSFHRYCATITHMSIKPDCTAIGYKAQFDGDDAVKELVADVGFEMQLEGYAPCTYSKPVRDWVSQLTLRLKNILLPSNTVPENAANAETPVYAKAFIRLKDGTKYSSDMIGRTFKEMIHSVDNVYDQLNTHQKNAVQNMASKYSQIMMGWDVEHFHHPEGGMWTKVNAAGFKNKLSQNGESFDIKPGSYVLTEDVTLNNVTMRIKTGNTVNICLNGHTIYGNQRQIRIYGTLNLCDCHEHGEAEGGMTSSFTSANGHGAVFYTYYGSTFNLYGGNLKATGTLKTSGVGAISHETQETRPDVPAGVMNMYGGTLNGGKTTGNGGLLQLYHGATFNMYGGELYGGSAGGLGGAVGVSKGCTANLMGGRIYGSADKNGHTINLTNGDISFGGDIWAEGVYMPYSATIHTEGLSSNAHIQLTCDVHGFLSDDPNTADCFVLDSGYTTAVVNGKVVAVKEAVTDISAKSGFRVGYSSICINPEQETGIPLSGYGTSSERLSTQITDDLYASATAVTDESGQTLLLITSDLQRPQEDITNVIRSQISKATGVPVDHIMLSASHSHSTPDLLSTSALIEDYKLLLYNHFTQAAILAMANRVPTTIRMAVQDAVKTTSGQYFNFSRHYYYYKQVSAYTGQYGYNSQTKQYELGYGLCDFNKEYCGDNFGTIPASADRIPTKFFHVQEGDHSMQLIRFVRSGEKDVLWCNFAAHPTMTGGKDKTDISSDYVGVMREKTEASGQYHFVFIQGAAGNMNPLSRITTEHTYDKNEYRTYGQDLAQAALNLLEKAVDVPAGEIQTKQYIYEATVEKPNDEEMERVNAYYAALKKDPNTKPTDFGFTSTYHASAVNAKHRLNATEKLELNVFSIGNSLGFFSLPGELWSDAAQEVKEMSNFDCTFTVGYTNGDWKYFVYGEAADGTYENYEYFYSRFVNPDTTRDMVAFWKTALAELYAKES